LIKFVLINTTLNIVIMDSLVPLAAVFFSSILLSSRLKGKNFRKASKKHLMLIAAIYFQNDLLQKMKKKD